MVDVEIEASKGVPAFDVIGLPDNAVKESRERIRCALRCCGINFPQKKVTINLAPADVKKTGSIYDLAITVALLRVLGLAQQEDTFQCAFVGEVALNGGIRAAKGILPMVILAKEKGIKRIYVPKQNIKEASVVKGIECFGVESIGELILQFSKRNILEPAKHYIPESEDFYGELDFADVKGQSTAKLAMEIAAAGGHNILMIGPPGSGKSMLAKRMPSILPKMTFEESIETTNIHSVAGLLDSNHPLITKRPFRAPHHTISAAGLAGGGTIPKPGEISLAHNGLLFMDELAEFSRNALEVLRQPLEDQMVTISRVSGSITYPCSFILIGAMNPCPCGYYNHPTRKCICNRKQVSNYLNRISGPLLDRFDIHLEVTPVEFSDLSSQAQEETSASIRQRVQAARDIQTKRFKGTGITCNAHITPHLLREVCPVTPAANDMLQKVFERLGLSARAYDKILKVARTVADMDNSEIIDKKHISVAVQFRTLDRKYWSD